MAYDISHKPTADTDCETLLKVATPELYRNNAFRILGLPVNVTLREIERHRKKLEMMTKLGIDSSDKVHGYLPLDPPPDEDAVRNAIERLRDPETRLVDEFFWFWPLQAGLTGDKALESLSKQNVKEALNIWNKHGQDEECCSISTHNIGVLYYLIALDMERQQLVGDSLDREKPDKCHSFLKKALEQWKKLLNDVKFWELLTNRIRELNDPRLTDITAKRIYNSLPKALLLINARLAVHAIERNDNGIAERNIQLMKELDFEERLIENVIHETASPIREHIKILCAGLVDKVSKKPDEANQLARNLLTQTKSSLKVIDMLLPKRSAIRESLQDEIAGIVRIGTIAYGNETTDWEECLWLTEQALSLATSTTLLNRLNDDARHIKENLEEKQQHEELKSKIISNQAYYVQISADKIAVPPICTCCLGQAESEQQVSYSWEEQRGISKYQHSRIFNFPICWTCKYHQTSLSQKRTLLVLLVVGISTGLSFFMGLGIGRAEYLVFIVIGSIITAFILGVFSKIIRLRPLDKEHASRGPTVSMSNVSKGVTTFSFLNPIYAWSFAQLNKVKMTSSKMTKYSYKPSLLRGRSARQVVGWITILAFICHSIVFAILDDQWNANKSYGTSSYSNPTRSYDSSSKSSNITKSQIDLSRSKLKQMEAELDQIASELEPLSSQIESFEAAIKDWESRKAQDLYVNEAIYNQSIDAYNELIEKYNKLLSNSRIKYAAYQKEFERVNEMIDQYNKGTR